MTTTDTLFNHVRALADDIGARPPASENERRAAAYVREQLSALGIENIREQLFNTPRSAGTTFLPLVALGAAFGLIGRAGRLGRIIGGIGLIWTVLETRRALLMEPPSFVPLAVGGESRNIIARVAPTGETKRFVFLVAHLDSPKQRLTVPLRWLPFFTKSFLTGMLASAFLSGIGLILSGVFGRGRRPARHEAAGARRQSPGNNLWGLLASLAFDETQPISDGANDNASGVAALLGLAETLRQRPLENTEVVLLFTGAATAGGIGITSYLDQYAPPKDFSTWINLEMVGATGSSLSYIAKGGLTHLTPYRAAPSITALTRALAEKHPEYGVYGKDILILDETAALRGRGYEAITLAGLDRGSLPRWHGTGDTSARLSPELIERALKFTRVIIDAIDGGA